MTTLDAIVLISILALIFSVIRCWRGPIPQALMRPSVAIRMGVDDFVVLSQDADGKRMRVEGRAMNEAHEGDAVFIEQPNGPTQTLYVSAANYLGRSGCWLLTRDPE